MRSLRGKLFPLILTILSAFVVVLILEGAHHHGALENSQDCSVCGWQQTGSQAPNTPVPPILSFTPAFSLLFTLILFHFSYISFPSLGRSPPLNLL